MKIEISSMCSGHGRCYTLYGEVYEPDEMGYEVHRDGGPFDVAPGLEAQARKAVSACPERAISIVER